MNVQAVILAAGSSSRMGVPKQLLTIGGKSMIDRAISVVCEAGFKSPILVLGAHAEQIYRQSEMSRLCNIIVNPDFDKGQSSSLITGVRHVPAKCDGALFMLCDQPFLRAELLIELTMAFIVKKPDILYPVYKTQRGNPAILRQSLFPRLLCAAGDQGARFLFHDKSLYREAHDVDDPAVVIDIDTPQEYEKYHLIC